jgi:hypothetical protein
MATLADLFAEALRHHRAGDLPRAEHLYRRLLQADAAHAGAWQWYWRAYCMANIHDWRSDGQLILQESLRAIHDFASAHPAEVCSFFAFGVDYYEGWISINFDLLQNSIIKARRRASRIRQSQLTFLQQTEGWRDARYYLAR